MKRLLTLFAIALIFSGCAFTDSIRARTMLQNCQFAVERVDLSLLNIAPTIRFKDKEISVENPPIKELVKLIPQITKGEFDVDLSKVTLKPIIAVDNPNDMPVVLDSMEFDVFLDEGFLMKAEHSETLRIPAKKSGSMTIDLTIPTNIPLVELVEAKQIHFKGKAFMKLDLTSKRTITLPVPITVSRDIPREKIYDSFEKEKEKLVQKLLKSVGNKSAKKVLDAFF